MGALPGDRVARRVRGGPRLRRRRRSPRCADRRADDIAHRRTAVTGVNEFPNLAEAPLPRAPPDSGGALRRRVRGAAGPLRRLPGGDGARPRCCCCRSGPLAEHNIRTTFAANLLASGGIEAVNPVRSRESSAEPRSGRGDLRYRRAVRRPKPPPRWRLPAARCRHVLLAGPEKAVAEADPPARRIPDRPDRRGRGPVGPAHPIGGLR